MQEEEFKVEKKSTGKKGLIIFISTIVVCIVLISFGIISDIKSPQPGGSILSAWMIMTYFSFFIFIGGMILAIIYGSKNIKIIAIILLAILIIWFISASVISTYNVQKHRKETFGPIQEAKELSDKALETGDINYCHQASMDDRTQKDCYYEFAVAYKNVSICDNLEDEYFNNKCISSLIEVTGDMSHVEKLKNRPDTFFVFIRENVNYISDTSSCDKIIDGWIKVDCYREFWSNQTISEEICNNQQKSLDKDYCFGILASTTNNKELCKNIQDDSTKYNIYFCKDS